MLLSLFQTILQYFFFYLGLANCTGVKSSIINGSGAFVVIILTTLVFRMEKMTWKKLAGCILGFAGIILINLGGDMSGFAWNGEGFIFMTVLSYAGSTILIKRFTGEGADPVMMSSLQFVFGGIVLTLLGLLMGGASEQWSFTGAGFGTLMWLSFVSAAAYSLWAVLLKHNPVSRVAVFGFLNPVCGSAALGSAPRRDRAGVQSALRRRIGAGVPGYIYREFRAQHPLKSSPTEKEPQCRNQTTRKCWNP